MKRIKKPSYRVCSEMVQLYVGPTDLGTSKPENEYEVFNEIRRSIGFIMLHPQAPSGMPRFWTVTVRVPQYPHNRGYAADQELAMAAFKAA